jgi:ABC-2 type transport system permease protein
VKNTWLIYRKELRSYFTSPIAYTIMALYALIFGLAFYIVLERFQQYASQAQMRGFPMSINEMIVAQVLGFMNQVGVFLIPMICMRLFAEEKRSGTIELLMTSPVRDIEVILGKWLAALALYAIILAVSAVNLTFLFTYGKPDWKPILVSYLGLLLQGGCLLAIGTFLSSLTRNQIIACVAGLCVSLVLFLLELFTAFKSGVVWKALGYISVVGHYEPFTKGVLDSKDVIFFLTATFFGLFLTARATESLRWRA